jgi:predicted neuraminidase
MKLELISSQFVFANIKNRPFSHCASIFETKRGDILVTWYSGSYETSPDQAILISRFDGKSWSKPEIVVDTPEKADGNPIIFEWRDKLYLFYVTIEGGGLPPEIGKNFVSFLQKGEVKGAWDTCSIKYKISKDEGKTFGEEVIFRKEWGWMIRNRPIILSNRELLFPFYDEREWKVFFGITEKDFDSFKFFGDLRTPKGCIHPVVVEKENGNLVCFLRTRDGFIYKSVSKDFGRTWEEPQKTCLKNPNSGIDLLKLRNGYYLLAYNDSSYMRSPLSLAISKDLESWEKILDVEKEPYEFSYPNLLEDKNGNIHLVYTWKRTHIKYCIFRLMEV